MLLANLTIIYLRATPRSDEYAVMEERGYCILLICFTDIFVTVLFYSLLFNFFQALSQKYEKLLFPSSYLSFLSVRIEKLGFHWMYFHEI